MQFEVNGQNYFLHFSDEEKHWVLFRPVEGGVEEVEIANDTAQPAEGRVILPVESDEGWVN